MLKQVQKLIMHIICFAECMLCNKKIKKSAVDNQSVCFVRFDGIGDFILWLDSASAFKQIFPGKRLVLICSTMVEPIGLQTGLFDKVISVNIKCYESLRSLNYHRTIRKDLNRMSFDILINPISSRNAYFNSIVSAIPSKKKITITGDPTCKYSIENKYTDRIYTSIFQVSTELSELRKNKKLIQLLGLKEFKSGYYCLPKIYSSFSIPKPYFVVQLGSSNMEKSWPAERFAEISHYINKKNNWNCCVVGLDPEMGKVFKENYKNNFYNMIGKTSLLDMIHIIQESEMILGDDSSGMHIAAFSGVKRAIAVAGNWEGTRFLPYDTDNDDLNKRITVIRKHTSCSLCHGRYTNECKKSINHGKGRICVSRVNTSDLIDII